MKNRFICFIILICFLCCSMFSLDVFAQGLSYKSGENNIHQTQNDRGVDIADDNKDARDVDDDQNELIQISSSDFVSHISHGSIVNVLYEVHNTCDCDAMSVTYMCTPGLFLESSSYMDADTSNATVTVSFKPQNQTINGAEKDALSYQEDQVVALVSFWKNESILYTKEINIWVLSTRYGTFISEIAPIANKRNYGRYLLENNIIDKAAYEDLNREFHHFDSESNKNIGQSYGKAVFDQSVSLSAEQQINDLIQNRYVQKESASAAQPKSEPTFFKPYAEITFTIIGNEEDGTINIYGNVNWYVNNQRYPAQHIEIRIMDDDALSDELIGIDYTDSNGFFNRTVNNQTGVLEGGCDVYLEVYSGDYDSCVYDGVLDSKPYYFSTDVYSNIIDQEINEYDRTTAECTCTTDNDICDCVVARAFSISNAIYYAIRYEYNINDDEFLSDNDAKVVYPFDYLDATFTMPVDNFDYVLLESEIYNQWDTIIHEYGHIIAGDMGIFAGVRFKNIFGEAFAHIEDANLVEYHNGNKEKGLDIAWNEGWASYYSWCVQNYYNLPSMGFPKTSTTSVFNYNLVNNSYFGEDNELAIAAMFVNLVSDNILTEEEIWEIVKTNTTMSLSEFYNLVIDVLREGDNFNGDTLDAVNAFLHILEEQNISAQTENISNFTTVCPTFEWSAPELSSSHYGKSYIYDYKYRVVFFKSDLTCLSQSSILSQCSYTPSVEQWSEIIASSPNGFYWTVITSEMHAPSNGYYSQFRHVDGITNRASTAQLGIVHTFELETNASRTASDGSTIPAKTSMKWYKFVVPADATYSFYSQGSVDTYGEVFTSMRSDYDSQGVLYSNDDSGEGLNFLITQYLHEGDTLYIRIRGYNSTSVGESTFGVRIDGVEVTNGRSGYINTLSSGDEQWFSFKPPSSGNYAICTAGYVDTVCDYYHGNDSNTYDGGGVFENFSFIATLYSYREYYFCIRGGDADDIGEYSFYILPLQTLFSYNSTYDSLDEGELNWYEFTAPEAGQYTFSTFGETNTFGWLHSVVNPELSTIGTVSYDNNGGLGDNCMLTYAMAKNETIYICIQGGTSSVSGEYSLCVVPLSDISTDAGVEDCLSAGGQKWYRFTAFEPGEYTFFSIGTVDTFGSLHTAVNPVFYTEGSIMYDDDSGEDNNFTLTYTMEENETVYVCVNGDNSIVAGDYILMVLHTHSVETLDTSIESSLEAGGYNVYQFTAPIEGWYTFYTTGVLDLYADVFLYPPAGKTTTENRIAYDDDSGDSYNCAVTLYLSGRETVYIRIQGYLQDAEGTFNFVVVNSILMSQSSLSYTDYISEGERIWYKFTAEESGTYEFYTTSNIDTCGSLFEFFVPDGSLNGALVSNDDGYQGGTAVMDNFDITYALSAGQTVYIRVNGYSTNTSGPIVFHIEKI